jgi:AI-2 transport protein TqsA
MRTAVTIACIVIILTALKLAASIVVPVLLAATFAIAFQPLTEVLARRGVPTIVAAITTVLVVLLAIGALGTLAAIAVTNLANDAPRYAENVRGLWTGILATLDDVGLGSMAEGMARTDIGDTAAGYVRAAAVWMSGAAGDLLNVLLLTVFIQLEATTLKQKLLLISRSEGVSRAARAFDQIQKYFRVKFVLAALNGFLLGIWCWIWGVDNPLVWGVAAFAMNFVPIIGSLIAAIPPILLGLVENGLGTSIGVAAGYVAVNIGVDNMLEPRLMGRTLDISPLVLLLSLLVWGFILGPIGALLSFPLTVAVRIYCEEYPSTRWVAVLLAAKTSPYEQELLATVHAEPDGPAAIAPIGPSESGATEAPPPSQGPA